MSAGLVVMMLSICTERGGGVRSKVDRWWEVLEWIYRSRWQGQRCVEGQVKGRAPSSAVPTGERGLRFFRVAGERVGEERVH